MKYKNEILFILILSVLILDIINSTIIINKIKNLEQKTQQVTK